MKRFFGLFLAAFVCLVPVTVFAQSAQEIMAKFDYEPTIEDTMNAAVNYAGLDTDRLEGLYTRAGAAKALPKVLSYELTYRDQDRDRPQAVYTYADNNDKAWSSYKVTDYVENTDYMQHKFKAQWDLTGVVYNSDQLRVVSLMNSSAKTRDSILKVVTKTYFARRKAQIDMLMNPPTEVSARLDAELKIQEMTATLDSLTGGWFSKNIRK